MGKKKKRVEIEAEPKTNNPGNSQTETETNLSLLNGDSHKKKKKKKTKAVKETDSEAKADEFLPLALLSPVPSSTTLNLSSSPLDWQVKLLVLQPFFESMRECCLHLMPPHHLRKHEWSPYREDELDPLSDFICGDNFIGVTLKERATSSLGTLVDVGLVMNIVVDQVLEPGIRVTVAMGTNHNFDSDILRQVVSSFKQENIGCIKCGVHPISVQYSWIAHTRRIASMMFSQGGYDHLIGTSEHIFVHIRPFRHLLIAFGGLSGLEKSVEEDHKLKGKNVRNVFDMYLNMCPHQGSRTIRTEEALFISLQYFQEPITRALQGAVS
ncbi:hypothetical protein CRYUN_Cryun36dG0051400 [Craigia yunnanensis]